MPLSLSQAQQRIRERLQAEEGTVFKDWGGRIPIALIFPNRYHVAMSNLGYQTLYGLFNSEPDIVCERLTWEGDDVPALSMETQRPVSDFPLWAFSVPFELDYLHLVALIRQSGIPLWAEDRQEGDPFLLGGGVAMSANPEPVAPFLDAVVIGEAEPLLGGLLAALRAAKGMPRAEILSALDRLEGVAVPARHRGQPLRRQWAADLSAFDTTSVVLTRETEFGDAFLIEVSRGCCWSCRFCLAGHLTGPPRFRRLAQLRPCFVEGLRRRPRVGLVGAAVSDHPDLEDMVRVIRELGGGLTLASLRADQLSPTLLEGLREGGTHTLTLAPEVGSPDLVETVAKGFGAETLLQGVEMARQAGLHRLKLYFMVGLPGEDERDIQGIVTLVQQVQQRLQGGTVRVSVTPFVPKAHTPFQWAPMADAALLEGRIRLLEQELRPLRVAVEAESVAWSRVQGVLSRGDRRLAPVLARMPRRSLGAWRRALAAAGLTEETYLRQRAVGESLPWDWIDSGESPAGLRREWDRAGRVMR